MAVGEGGAPRDERLSLIGTLITGVVKILVWALFAAVISVIIEWVCIFFNVWSQPGAQHSQHMLDTERGYLIHAVQAIPLIEEKDKFLVSTFRSITFDPSWGLGLVGEFASGLYEYSLAGVNILMVFSCRLVVLTLSIPAFVLFGVVGIVRGLVARDLRKWGGGRETSGTYHLALRFLPDVTIGLWALYLAMPISLNPFFIVGPVVILFAVVMAQLTYRFKKYV